MKVNLLQYGFLLLLLSLPVNAQDVQNIETPFPVSLTKDIESSSAQTGIKIKLTYREEKFIQSKIRPENLAFSFFRYQKKQEHTFDVVSSFGDNMNVGFWDKYTVVNYTPQLYIEPAGFINVYANHNSSFLVPIEQIKNYAFNTALQSLAILALDNSSKMFFNSKSWLAQILIFTAKNLIINLFVKPVIYNTNDVNSKILKFDNYYCAVRIRF